MTAGAVRVQAESPRSLLLCSVIWKLSCVVAVKPQYEILTLQQKTEQINNEEDISCNCGHTHFDPRF